MGAVLALVVMLAAVVFAVWPIVRRAHDAAGVDPELSELLGQRDLALNDIRELDFDRDLGNLSDEDHQQLREQSKRHAVAILKRLQAEDHRVDEEIEQAVAGLRGHTSSE